MATCTNLDEVLLDLHYGSQSPLYDIHAFFKLNVDFLTTIAGTVRCVKPRVMPVYPFRGPSGSRRERLLKIKRRAGEQIVKFDM